MADDNGFSCFKLFFRILFSHVGMLLLVAGYTILGAYIFVWVEKPAEEERRLEREVISLTVNDSLTYLVNLFWYWHTINNDSKASWNEKVYGELDNLNKFIIDAVTDYGYDGTFVREEWDYDWTLSNSLLYVVTISSTIGYGHIAPVTQLGKLATILYAIVGIPLLLVCLANIGDAMASCFRWIYSRLCCRWCRARRRRAEYTPLMVAQMGGRLPPLHSDEVGEEEYMPTTQVVVPIVLNLILISMYILIGAILFGFWEGWDLLSAAYFTFVTLTTIGFGDYTPGKSFLNYKDGVSASMTMVATCAYVLLGMALVSMCINLMQEQLIEKVKWFGREIGLIKTPTEEKSRSPSIHSSDTGQKY
ncbi:TWiK family of potassium channels protein 7-like [Centruroides sculpturatus]|uniref:TWiK family of potassium channels protein 7-like n=1 Tax=Centruroides sculpturatus TaxID=218467 RepID=UPI000C6EF4F5|nr:TWiK family of potassium channels protein 7-like [Centruroides sculpturatus]